jgi:type I restriction enzyme, S subunit
MSLPKGWANSTSGEVFQINPKHSAETDRKQQVSFVAMPSVNEHTGTITSAVDRLLSDVWTGYTHFADGDVIFAKITPCMENGKAAVARGMTNSLACGSTEFYVLRTNGAAIPEYLWRYLRQESFRESAKSQMSGAVGQQRVPRQYLEEHPFQLPPLEEQRRIVAKLDVLFACLARARAELDRVPILCEQLRKQTLRRAFNGSLTADWRRANGNLEVVSDDVLSEAYRVEVGSSRRAPPAHIDWRPSFNVPPTWRWVSVDQVITQTQYGSSAKTTYVSDGVPVLRMGNIQRGKLDYADLKYLPRDHREFPDLLLREGDVLFNRTNSFELVGKTAVCKNLDRPMSFASYLIRMRPFGILPDLLSAYLNSPFARSWIERVASQQVGQANVNGSKLKALGIPLPPFDEQAEIWQRISSTFAHADRLEAESARACELLGRLEASILIKAFKGELVLQDLNDEPASILLDRIRAQRAPPTRTKIKRKSVAPA